MPGSDQFWGSWWQVVGGLVAWGDSLGSGGPHESLEETPEVGMRLRRSIPVQETVQERVAGKDWGKAAGQGWAGREISVRRPSPDLPPQPQGPLISRGLLPRPWLGEGCDRGLSGLLSSETLQAQFVSPGLGSPGLGPGRVAQRPGGGGQPAEHQVDPGRFGTTLRFPSARSASQAEP